MKIHEKIQTLRAELTNLDIKKSGKNKFANFNYYTLEDFIPTVNQLMAKHKLFTVFNMDKEIATLTVYDSESEESVQFTTPVASAGDKVGVPVQALGAIHTYLKRYLYMNFLELTEGDVLDSVLGDPSLENKKSENLAKQKSDGVSYVSKSKTQNMAKNEPNTANFNSVQKVSDKEQVNSQTEPEETEIPGEPVQYANAEQVKIVYGLISTHNGLKDWLLKSYGTDVVSELTFQQAQYIIDSYNKKKGNTDNGKRNV